VEFDQIANFKDPGKLGAESRPARMALRPTRLSVLQSKEIAP
jgi:hypothetical protein